MNEKPCQVGVYEPQQTRDNFASGEGYLAPGNCNNQRNMKSIIPLSQVWSF